MRILAFDTTLGACSAAVFDATAQRLLAHSFRPLERGHAEALVGMVRAVLDESGVALSHIERIAVTIGPGTFTGVRIGLALARGLKLALGTPVCGLTSLEAIRLNVTDNPERRAIAALIDARRGEFYCAAWSAEGAAVVEPCAVRHDDAAHLVPAGSLIVGTGAERFMELAGEAVGARRAAVPDLPDAARIAEAASRLTPAPEPPQPLYLRPPGAQLPARKSSAGKSSAQIAGEISIIEATPVHAPVLSALYAQCCENDWPGADMARLMATPGAVALIACVGPETDQASDRPVAFVLARHAADEAEIISIGTVPEMRRRGVAAKLIARLIERLKTAGAGTLFIEVAARNEAARALYHTLGFSAAGVRPGYYAKAHGEADDAIVMRLAL
jgi:tRNA threonylcarbamoyl adenosine modification protein YeaZ